MTYAGAAVDGGASVEAEPRTEARDGTEGPPRRRLFLWWTLLSVAAVILSFVLGTYVRSPQDVAVANAQSTAVVTAEVERRTLTVDRTSLSGTVSLGAEQMVLPTGGGADVRQVVTAVGAAPGTVLRPTDLLTVVSGRPLIAWHLPYPLYRSLRPGDEGDDVRAVQEALVSAGLLASADGSYGRHTASAVRELYRRHDLAPPLPDTETTTRLESAQEEVRLAQAALDAPTPVVGPEASGTEQAQERIAMARAELATASLAAETPLPLGEVVTVPADGTLVTGTAAVGTVLSGDAVPVATLRAGTPSVTLRVPVADQDALPVGATAVISNPADPAVSVEAAVRSLGAFDAGGDGALPGVDAVLDLPADHPFTDEQDVLVSPSAVAATAEGSTVPVVALRKGDDGTYVLLAQKDGTTRRVPVTVRLSVDGWALIEDGSLTPGDRVVVAGA